MKQKGGESAAIIAVLVVVGLLVGMGSFFLNPRLGMQVGTRGAVTTPKAWLAERQQKQAE